MSYELDTAIDNGVKIKVIGVGGGGNNTINRMISSNVRGVDFVVVNTDKPVLAQSLAPTKISIGDKATRGHGAGANPEVGKRAAEESMDEIVAMLEGTDMVFLTMGMGGGTGTGASPLIAKAARDMGILTVAICTKPFAFEGPRRMAIAEEGIRNLKENVDSLIIIPNERLKMVSETRITLMNAFEVADSVLTRGVQSISELINVPGMVNLDFADVTTIMQNAGLAHMGVGNGKGKDKAEYAAKMAISSPLLETSISGARGIIVNITGSPDIGFEEVDLASNLITSEADPNATIIWGAAFDETLEDEIRITVVATGLDGEKGKKNDMPLAASAVEEIVTEKKEEKENNELGIPGIPVDEDGLDDLVRILNRPKNND